MTERFTPHGYYSEWADRVRKKQFVQVGKTMTADPDAARKVPKMDEEKKVEHPDWVDEKTETKKNEGFDQCFDCRWWDPVDGDMDKSKAAKCDLDNETQLADFGMAVVTSHGDCEACACFERMVRE